MLHDPDVRTDATGGRYMVLYLLVRLDDVEIQAGGGSIKVDALVWTPAIIARLEETRAGYIVEFTGRRTNFKCLDDSGKVVTGPELLVDELCEITRVLPSQPVPEAIRKSKTVH